MHDEIAKEMRKGVQRVGSGRRGGEGGGHGLRGWGEGTWAEVGEGTRAGVGRGREQGERGKRRSK